MKKNCQFGICVQWQWEKETFLLWFNVNPPPKKFQFAIENVRVLHWTEKCTWKYTLDIDIDIDIVCYFYYWLLTFHFSSFRPYRCSMMLLMHCTYSEKKNPTGYNFSLVYECTCTIMHSMYWCWLGFSIQPAITFRFPFSFYPFPLYFFFFPVVFDFDKFCISFPVYV